MSQDDLVEDSAAPKPKAKATEKAVEAIAETTGVEVENVTVEEAKVEETEKVITGPEKPKRQLVSNVQNNEDNIFSSKAADRSFKKIVETKEDKKDNKVALWSDKNIRWDGIGTLKKGYNIVSKEASAKWLSRNGIRNATPQEIATYYGK